jgi:hypothetical protein
VVLQEIGKLKVDVSLAKPQTENAQKKKEMRRKQMDQARYMGYGPPVRGGFIERGRGSRGGYGRGGRAGFGESFLLGGLDGSGGRWRFRW